MTGRIGDRLREHFGEENVFTDVDDIPLGVDFRACLDEEVSQCDVLLAVIRKDWLSAKNSEGELRLSDPGDFVRIEIESALKRDIPVIPLLVRNASVPLSNELPKSIENLAFRNALKIRPDPDFSNDINRLIQSLIEQFELGKSEPIGTKRNSPSRTNEYVDPDNRTQFPKIRWVTGLTAVIAGTVLISYWYFVLEGPGMDIQPMELPIPRAQNHNLPPSEIKPLPDITLILNAALQFRSDSDFLVPGAQDALQSLFGRLENFQEISQITGVGHAYSGETIDDNQFKSEQRAQYVAKRIAIRFPEVSITSSGQGDKSPVASNFTAEGRAQNRRVELTILVATE